MESYSWSFPLPFLELISLSTYQGMCETSGSAKHPILIIGHDHYSLELCPGFARLSIDDWDCSVVAFFLANQQLVFEINWNIQLSYQEHPDRINIPEISVY